MRRRVSARGPTPPGGGTPGGAAHGSWLGRLAAQVLLDSRTQFPPEALDPGRARTLTPP